MAKKQSLGRGLSALMAEMGSAAPSEEAVPAKGGVAVLPVAMIAPNPKQPRRQFDETALTELANSILARGVLQPILVRPVAGAGDGAAQYEIVAGERRWRASQLAGLHEIPVVIREMGEGDGFEAALIENIQRADLNPLEEALGYQRLMRDYGHSQEAVSQLTGKSRSHVGNLLRLIDLPEEAKALVQMGLLSLGHAKAVLGAAEPAKLAREIAERGLSVRQAEEEARRSHDAPKAPRAAKRAPGWDAEADNLQAMLEDVLGMRVALNFRGSGGMLQVKFSDLDQLDELVKRLGGGAR